MTAIIATLSLSAVLSLRLAPGETPAARMDAFARAVRFLQDEALYTGRNFAFSFTRSGWRTLEFHELTREWLPRPEERLHDSGAWSEDFRTALVIEDRRVTLREQSSTRPEPDVMLLASGESTPFSISMMDDEGRSSSCALSAFGELECHRGG